MNKSAKIFVAGHRGLVGSALVRLLRVSGYENLVLRTSKELDLRNQASVNEFFALEKPDYVFLAAAKVGGINANMTFPADFIYDNLVIQSNVIKACFTSGVKKTCFLGSSCIYPRDCPQPMKEEYLLSGPLEPTNEGYAIAKIAGLKLMKFHHQQYGLKGICPMPCNLYGPGDSFDLSNSHVLSALVRRFVEAVNAGRDEITLWGSGIARREFLHVDDMARAVLFLMEKYDSPDVVNVGSGNDLTIKELAEMIAEKTGFSGKIFWDTSKPDGMLRKCLDVSRITQMGFQPKISLSEGVDQVIHEFCELNSLSRQNKEL
ncbi:MAG: GDP-L-fucose synthase [Candidatus Riflebacteria bacterium]|nr:GDP-L-fucose synthase [Candidatus Riflebacteria bacterium]